MQPKVRQLGVICSFVMLMAFAFCSQAGAGIGKNHVDPGPNDATTQSAKVALSAAYNDAAGRPSATTVGTELGGKTLVAGVYNSAAGTFGMTGTLVLDGQNNPDAVFIFQTASTLITAASANVKLIHGAQARNIFWQVGSSATLGASSTLRGTILAHTTITLGDSVTVDGRLLAGAAPSGAGAVTLIHDKIVKPSSATITKSGSAAGAAASPPTVDLAEAGQFAVLAGSGITNTGATTIGGDAGSSPTSTQTGFDAVTFTTEGAPILDEVGDTFGPGVNCPAAKTPQPTSCFFFPDGSEVTNPNLCAAAQDPAALSNSDACGHMQFALPVAGAFTASVTYNNPTGFTLLSVNLCQEGQLAGDPANCPQAGQTVGNAEQSVFCTAGTSDNLTAGTSTTSITCQISAADPNHPYHLIITPFALMSCDAFLIPDCVPPGTIAILTASFNPVLPDPTTPVRGKVRGGGEVGLLQKFSLHASNNPDKWSRAKVHFVNRNSPTRCRFDATNVTLVGVTPDASGHGGTADISGQGVVKNAAGQTTVDFTLHLVDGGTGSSDGDQFLLTATGCSTDSGTVTKGNITITAGHDRQGHETEDDD